MKNHLKYTCFLILSTIIVFAIGCSSEHKSDRLSLNDSGYFESAGVNVLVFSNWYNGYFSDSKMSGIELIHHECRTATNGDIRLSPTPEQWDLIPVFLEREVDTLEQSITAVLSYPEYDFTYKIKATPKRNDLLVQIILDEPLPDILDGVAGFNMEFLPSAYFHSTYMMDAKVYSFPLYASGSMEIARDGSSQPLPLASGKELVLAPENQERRVTLSSAADIALYDGRNKAQNGWFVARSLIPTEKTGVVLEWTINASQIYDWEREPVISHSQVGYHPEQKKVAVIEMDKRSKMKSTALLYKINSVGKQVQEFKGKVKPWGTYLRYSYASFDFSSVREEGTYMVEYDGVTSDPILIKKDVYSDSWQATLDIYFPVQMDHMLVNEAYRVWHGAAHLDDARQAPVNHEHFDLYAQGPTTDTPFKPGEHIPGLNVGGWFDAGDYDIRTQTQYSTVMGLVQVWENFSIDRDQTLVDQNHRYVDLHMPDGKPDILQQIEHGAIGLLAQHKAVGHAISGIIVPDISQYTHLGDALTMTDNLVFNPKMKEDESNGYFSGKTDDRWAFTSRSSSLNYGSAAALAASSRALKEYSPAFANECLETSKKVWMEEQAKEADVFRVGNTTGGKLETEQLRAAVELLESTGDEIYKKFIEDNLSEFVDGFGSHAVLAVRVLPYMNEKYSEKIRALVLEYKELIDSLELENPFGVPITTGGWAGNGRVISHSVTSYYLNKAFPDIIDAEDVFEGLNYLYGCHPGSAISFVSGVGTRSKQVAYGMNRADFSFIAGGIVPGVLILPPDFPENKEDWPFLWGENEYVISLGASYIFAVKAAEELLRKMD